MQRTLSWVRSVPKPLPEPPFMADYFYTNAMVRERFLDARADLLKNSERGSSSIPASLLLRPSQKPKSLLNYSIVYANGKVEHCSKHMNKSTFCLLYDMQPRHVRAMDGTVSHEGPMLVVTDRAFLCSLIHLKFILQKDCVILMQQPNHDNSLLRERLVSQCADRPFVQHVLETVFQSLLSEMNDWIGTMLPQVDHTLMQLMHHQREVVLPLRQLLEQKRRITHQLSQVVQVRDALTALLASPEDLDAMAERLCTDRMALELLWEHYWRQYHSIASRLQQLQSHISSTEDVLQMGLIGQRNALMHFDVQLSAAQISVACAATGAALFGMNLWHGWEQHPYAWLLVTVGSFAVASSVYRHFLMQLRRVVK